jgi:hypothetical protein
MANYKPRRASKRWLDSDCPAGVLAIFDHPKYGDRYTVIYAEPIAGETYADMRLWYRGMSANPFHPQGIGMAGEMQAHEAALHRYYNRNRACRWSDLPEDVKRCVRQDLAPEAGQ